MDVVPPFFRTVMDECFCWEPSQRPDFKTILAHFTTANVAAFAQLSRTAVR
jgi:hypothetical protein